VSDSAAWLTSTLWPTTSPTTVVPGARAAGRFVAVPNATAPRQLIPWRPSSAWAVTRRATDDRSRARLVLDGLGVLGLLAAAPLSRQRRIDVDATIEGSLVEALRERIDSSIHSAIVLWGPPRANRKPVLQLSDRRGRTVAFAKVAWNELTTELLDQEEQSLRHLARIAQPGFVIPRVLGREQFGSVEWLALSPAGVASRNRATETSAFELARMIERTAASSTAMMSSSPFLGRLSADVGGLGICEPLVAALQVRHGDRQLAMAAWHGDFVPWNFLSGSPQAAIWDWERYDQSVPVGFDRLHYCLQMQLHRQHVATEVAVRSLLTRSAAILPELEADDARLHAELYVAEIAARYEHDAALAESPDLQQRVVELDAALRRSWSR
jgi:hypothetical protein